MKLVLLVVAFGVLSVMVAYPVQQAPDGAALYDRECASCHANPASDSRAPNRDALRTRTVDAVVAALSDGAMRLQGARLTAPERRAVAEFLTTRRDQTPTATA